MRFAIELRLFGSLAQWHTPNVSPFLIDGAFTIITTEHGVAFLI